MSLIFNKLAVIKTLNSNHPLNNKYANNVKILGACKHFAQESVNERTNGRTGAVKRTIPFFLTHSVIKKLVFSEKKFTFASSINHITILNSNYDQ